MQQLVRHAFGRASQAAALSEAGEALIRTGRLLKGDERASATPLPFNTFLFPNIPATSSAASLVPSSSSSSSSAAAAAVSAASSLPLAPSLALLEQINPKNLLISFGASIHPSATIVGNVIVDNQVVIGNNVSLISRSSNSTIHIGFSTTIGDGVVITSSRNQTTKIGPNAVIGANTVIESATIEADVKVGANCVISERSLVEKGAVLDDGTVVLAGVRIPSLQRWAGNPAAFVDDVHDH